MRNDDRWPEVALTTIREGRPDKGMPTWKDALKEDQIQEILAFLKTIQK
jgi:mono/diheme cytochrome c family protein